MIYLDHAATTPMSHAAIEKMLAVSKDIFGNPSSTHAYGRAAAALLREARQTIASAIHAKPSQIIFTSGGTEANNTAIRGAVHKASGNHIITSSIEHHSVLHTMEALEKEGFEVTYLDPEKGLIQPSQVQAALRPTTCLVSIMSANNETGALMPISEIGAVLSEHPALFHVDAVQALGKIDIDVDRDQVDFLSVSAHKIHGPKGVGFLYARENNFQPLLLGGDQEDKRRAGTENLTGIAAMAEAVKEQVARVDENEQKVKALRNRLLGGLPHGRFYINEPATSLPYVVNLGFPGWSNELLLMRLDLAGIAVSTGSACTAGAIEPSHVLTAMYGPDSPRLTESIRISLSDMTTEEEIDQFLETIKEIIGE